MVEQNIRYRPDIVRAGSHGKQLLRFGIMVIFLAVVLAAGTTVQAVEQAPAMPHIFFGTVFIGDQPAPGGVQVEAVGAGVRTGIEGNPLSTGNEGTYGGPGSFDPKLVIQGELAQNTAIEFYVNGVRAECLDVSVNSGWTNSYPWKSAGFTELNLRVASLPETFITIKPTTPVTTTVNTYRTPVASGGGGGGGGGGGFYSGSVASVTTAATKNVTTVQTTVPAQNITEQTTPVENTTVAMSGQEEITVTMTQQPTKTGGAFPIPMNTLFGIFAVIVIVIIGLIGIMREKRG